MPSSLAAGLLQNFIRVAKKLTIKSSGVLHFEPRSEPEDGEEGDVYFGTDGNLYVHNGTDFVIVGTQTGA